ncbi:MAG TPA: MFS transporter [Acidimicrobiales bacterium]|nr:MFS transporter [Acidimicrobiales bacterium]
MTVPEHPGLRLFNRTLSTYPGGGRRSAYLAVVVLTTIVLYYQQYVAGSVSPSILAYYQISFRFYLGVVVLSSVMGAVASLLAGLADRWGRANLVIWGLLAASLTTAFGLPSATTGHQYAAMAAVVGFVEGMVLVATPALVRDFSPQAGRGTAMGIWSLGPVVGSLTVSEVASHTLAHLHAWQDQFHIAGLTGLVVFVIALVNLRELSPQLRDQLMVSIRERVLVEARARGIDIAAALRHPWRQMLQVDVVLPALGVSLFLLIYYAAVGFFVIYFTSVFGFTQAQANGLGNWFWAADAVTVVVIGIISDRAGVRKPFIVAGSLMAVVMTIIFAGRATQAGTSYGTFILLVSFLSASRGFAYAPWMTAFTETVEHRNPALVATGLAVWGWVLRVVVAVSFLVLPYVVTSVTPVAEYGPQLLTITTQYASQVATLESIDVSTLTKLRVNPNNTAAAKLALAEIGAHFHIPPSAALARLLAVRAMPTSARLYLASHGNQVKQAKRDAPHQWERWWWVCVAGEVLFIPTNFMLVGRWRRSTARRDAAERQALVDSELARLRQDPSPSGTGMFQ